jgi:hypothetical protein
MATPTYLLELLFTALLNSIQTKHTILINSSILGSDIPLKLLRQRYNSILFNEILMKNLLALNYTSIRQMNLN